MRSSSVAQSPELRPRRVHRLLLPLAVLLLAAIGATGWLYFRHREVINRRAIEDELSAIADLKAGQIADWIKERRSDAEMNLSKVAAEQFLTEPANDIVRGKLVQWMTSAVRDEDYRAVALFDSRGALRLAVPEDASLRNTNVMQIIRSGLRARDVIMSDLHREPLNQSIHMYLAVPVGMKPQTNALADGVLLFDIDPEQFLYPLVQSWPTPSRTAETMLVERAGNDVLFLNDLRHQTNAALTLRLPIDPKSDLPATMAVLGQQGVFEGADYHKTPVLAIVRKIPGTPWFMVAKEDQAEIFAPIRREAWTFGLFVSALMLAAVLVFCVIWHQQKLSFTRQEMEEAKARQREIERLNQLYATLSQVSQTVARVNSREELFREVCRMATGFGAFKLAWIGEHNPRTREITPVAWAGEPQDYARSLRLFADDRPEAQGPAGTAIREGRPDVCNDMMGDPRMAPWREVLRTAGMASAATVPIHFGGAIWGEISLYSGERNFFQTKEIQLLEGMALDIASAMQHLAGEAALRESEERHRTILRTAMDGFIRVNEQGRLLEVNDAYCRMSGYTEQELLAKSIVDLEADEKSADVTARVQAILAGGEDCFETHHRRKDGSIFAVEISLKHNVSDESYVAAFVKDITERKRTEQHITDALNFNQTLLEVSPVGIVTYKASGECVTANETLARIIGGTVEQLKAQNFRQLASWKRAGALAAAEAALSTGEAQRMETEFLTTFGRSLWLTFRLVPFRFQGEPHLLAMVADITERIQAEEERARLFTAIQQAAETIVMTDTRGNITYVNPAFEKTTGYTLAEALGRNPRFLKSGRQQTAFYRQMWDTLNRGEVWHGHFVNKRKDGTLYEEDATISPIRDAAGRITSYLALKLDVTHQATLEAQLRQSQKMEAIGQLAGGVAHDFNNILAVVQLHADLMKTDHRLSPEHRQAAADIGEAVRRATALTRQLLLFGRKEELQLRDVELNDVINQMMKMLRRVLGENIELQFRFSLQPMFIHADPGMMDQVLMNLSLNSRDAMPKGGRLVIETSGVELDKLAVTQFRRGWPGSFVRLSVSDTGSGIPPKDLDRIFEPFYTTKEAGKGTGLGLAVVHGIVQQHRGWINVYSDGRHGTTFHVYLPRLRKTSEPKPERAAPIAIPGGNETILFVEDDAYLRASVRGTLSDLGYRVLEAGDGVEALELWKQHREEIHLLLTDLVMPGGITGMDLGKQLLQEAPALKAIYTSGYSAGVVSDDFPLEEGVNFLGKPFPAIQLARTIRARLDG